MPATNIRIKLHRFIDSLEDKKAEAIYTLFEDEIEQNETTYPDEFKNELDKRYAYYQDGGAMVSEAEANEQIEKLMKKDK